MKIKRTQSFYKAFHTLNTVYTYITNYSECKHSLQVRYCLYYFHSLKFTFSLFSLPKIEHSLVQNVGVHHFIWRAVDTYLVPECPPPPNPPTCTPGVRYFTGGAYMTVLWTSWGDSLCKNIITSCIWFCTLT